VVVKSYSTVQQYLRASRNKGGSSLPFHELTMVSVEGLQEGFGSGSKGIGDGEAAWGARKDVEVTAQLSESYFW
jgi:hypothetical protein